jgi:hypothetical protein
VTDERDATQATKNRQPPHPPLLSLSPRLPELQAASPYLQFNRFGWEKRFFIAVKYVANANQNAVFYLAGGYVVIRSL